MIQTMMRLLRSTPIPSSLGNIFWQPKLPPWKETVRHASSIGPWLVQFPLLYSIIQPTRPITKNQGAEDLIYSFSRNWLILPDINQVIHTNSVDCPTVKLARSDQIIIPHVGVFPIKAGAVGYFHITAIALNLSMCRSIDQEEAFVAEKKAKHAEAQKRYRQKAKLSKSDVPFYFAFTLGTWINHLSPNWSSRLNVTRINQKAMDQ